MASKPVLLTPGIDGTVSILPYFELYAISDSIDVHIRFQLEVIDVLSSAYFLIDIDDAGWNKEYYSSGEIAVYPLSAEHQLINGRQYKWRSRSYDGFNWSDYADYHYFNVLSYRGESGLGIFTIDENAVDAMRPELISAETIKDGTTNHGDGAVLQSRIPTLTWGVPYGLGEGIHFRLELDVVNTFDSRNLLRYETKYDNALFQAYDGVEYLDFPETGTVFGTLRVKMILPDTFFNDKYYWRVIPAI